QSDRLRIGGTATLAGSVGVSVSPELRRSAATYTILSAVGGRLGTYAGATTNLAFVQPSLTYDAKHVFLTLAPSFAGGGRTGNQQAVGHALDQALAGATGDFANVLQALQQLDPVQGPKVLETIGGQIYAGFGSLMMQGSLLFMNSFSSHAGAGGGTSYQAM